MKAALLLLLSLVDRAYLRLERTLQRRVAGLALIPALRHRRGGKRSYGEWCYTAGVVRSLIGQYCDPDRPLDVVDVGSGAGLGAVAARPFVVAGGSFTGLDVDRDAVEFCRGHFPAPFRFLHLPVGNAAYAPTQDEEPRRWPLEADAADLVTAVSVWTHLNERDARFYLAEVARVLRPGGTALVTMFLLDDRYDAGRLRDLADSRYHRTAPHRWVFEQAASPSGDWRTPAWTDTPERAIGVTGAGLEALCDGLDLSVRRVLPGTWKEHPGIYFQDVVVLQTPDGP